MYLRLIYFCIGLLSISRCYGQNRQLKIISTDHIETSIIDEIGYINQHSDFPSVEQEITKTKSKLINVGYINSIFISLDSVADTLFVAKFHLHHKIENIHIYTNQFLSEHLKHSLNEKILNDTLIVPYKEVEKTLENLSEKLASEGYPFLTLSLSNISHLNDNNLRADLIVHKENQKRILNDILIKGYENFPKSYLKQYLKLKTGKNFNVTEIKKKTKSLNNLSFAMQSKAPEILFSKDSTKLYIYIKKRKSNTFDGFIGFTTNEASNKIEFNGYLDLTLENNLNYGERLMINYKGDESDQTNFNIEAHLPYLFKSPIGLNTALNIIRVDSTFSNTSQKANITYQINSKNLLYSGIKTNTSTTLKPSDNLRIKNFNSNFTAIGYQYLKRQSANSLFPIKTNLTLEFGFGSRTHTTKTKQNTLEVDANHIFSLNERHSFYIRGKTKILNSHTYLENELYRFGGINSIRGFSENSILTSTYYLINTEYRYNLSSNSYINSVIDFASFKNDMIKQYQKIYGFGFGFGLLTKSGLFNFIYANGKDNTVPFKINNSKIHLKLTAIF